MTKTTVFRANTLAASMYAPHEAKNEKMVRNIDYLTLDCDFSHINSSFGFSRLQHEVDGRLI